MTQTQSAFSTISRHDPLPRNAGPLETKSSRPLNQRAGSYRRSAYDLALQSVRLALASTACLSGPLSDYVTIFALSLMGAATSIGAQPNVVGDARTKPEPQLDA